MDKSVGKDRRFGDERGVLIVSMGMMGRQVQS